MYNMRPPAIVSEEESELRRGPWTLEEDNLLTHYIARHGEGRWNMLAKCSGLKRTGKSCRLRWLNYLNPDIKRGDLTPEEQLQILELHSKWGNRWSKIAQRLPGRTDNEIKNYWRTRVQKQARQLNIESDSKKFMDAVRCFWMPRLLQKVEQSSSSFTSSSSLATTPNNIPQIHQEIASLPSNFSTTTYFAPQTRMTHYYNSDLGNENSSNSTTSSSVISADSITNTSKNQPEILLHNPINNAPSFPDTSTTSVDNNSTASDSYYVDMSSGYDMDGVLNDMASMSDQMGNFENSPYEFQVAEGNWVFSYNDVADTMWNNMDDIWQFREQGGMWGYNLGGGRPLN